MRFIILIVFCSLVNFGSTANILFYFVVSGYSHRIGVWPIIQRLAESGHNVTFLSPYPNKNQVAQSHHVNITDYVPHNLAKDIGIMDIDKIGLRLREGVAGIENMWSHVDQLAIRSCEALMKKPEFQTWVETSSFDLIVSNTMYNECGYGLVHKFGAKHIAYSSTTHMMWFKDAYAYPDENLPEIQTQYAKDMTFFQSLRNELVSLSWQWWRYRSTFPKIEAILRDRLELDDLPPIDVIERNTSLIFTNTHPSEEYARSLPPNFIGIGGTHCSDERKPLPEDLESFITNSSTKGFILLSFGTYADLSSLPKYLQNYFFNAMSKVPDMKFIVKFNAKPPYGLASNIKTVNWIPQQDLIAHPKIKAFIGHGGVLGTQEAIYHAVPMIVIPFFSDQDYQAARAHQRETAIALEIRELTEEKLLTAILQVLNNPKYKENTARISKFFRDRPSPPVESAVWWIEYVLRHDACCSHLRPIGLQRTWYERRMLDIWGFIAFCGITIFAILVFAIYHLFSGVLNLLICSKIKLD
ncbi:UDP-glucuronosyltransferase 2A3 [Folsomia candida]|uniref:UDP-glucuronosyltransferase n=2 Tax=Folsomia candida TaxID=158441 RepID=A0A226DIU4_FOLCA|nr:UDP-glucuronosyltransferase 2A3 [Folsomia candida]